MLCLSFLAGSARDEQKTTLSDELPQNPDPAIDSGLTSETRNFAGVGMSYAQNIQDGSLDRGYEYDQAGRLAVSHAGAEARAHAYSGQWGTMDGPYSQGYEYDVWGNVTHKFGWGGEVQGGGAGQSSDIYYSYTGNRRNGFSYDAAGNLTNDLGQTFTYDATGQQATAAYGGYLLQQVYDGDGLRVKKVENGATTLYLRSTVLGGQIVAEMNGSGGWTRGFVYLGSQLLAVQQAGVNWMHEDPITKSKRLTNSAGTVVSTVELDPWGADTNRSSNAAFQPRKFTTYDRDSNGTDEAMFRRYNRWQSRFDQPDPYDGSYDFTDPQSFNRYAYVQNDPVNFVDPTGLRWQVVETCSKAGDDDRTCRVIGIYWIPDPGPFSYLGYYDGRDRPRGGRGPQNPKEIEKRIAEGQAWDKWQAWVNCNTPIMNKHNAQIKEFLQIGGEAFWWEVGAGIGAATAVFGAGSGKIGGNAGTGTEGDFMDGGPVVGIWGAVLIVAGTHVAERQRINNIKAEYQKEVDKNCGAKPPHP